MDDITLNYSSAKLKSYYKLSDNKVTNKVGNLIKNTIDARISKKAIEAKKTLLSKTGKGNEFLGWVDLPIDYDKEEFERIKTAATTIRKNSDVLIVIGIGGSYLGAKAADVFLNGVYGKLNDDNNVSVLYVGNNLSSSYYNEITKLLEDKDFSINVISKSGTTTEPAIAFRYFKNLLVEKYGVKNASKRIYATTDSFKGALKMLSDDMGYETFVVPDDIGGRFSVLTAVGLLPIAVSGADIDELMKGAKRMRKLCIDRPYEECDALIYAAMRNNMYMSGKTTEVLANYEPCLHYLAEWWKQLFGESEGKDGKGIFPAAVDLTTDLHSMGQYIQDGKRNLFETVLNIEKSDVKIKLEESDNDLDRLNYLAGKDLEFVNSSAMKGTILAHNDGGVPVIVINIPKRNEFYLGELFYFFEFAVGISGYMLGVNPFDQPGVESYKTNMFALLGKPGYEEERKIILNRLEGKNE